MSTTITLDDTNANRTRAGAFLLLAALVLTTLGALLHHLASSTGLPSDPTAAAKLLVDQQGLFTLASWTRLCGSVLGAVGAFFLATRHVPSASGFPGSAFWQVTGLGYLVLAGLYTFRATGFMSLAVHQADVPVVFEAALGTTLILGILGNVLVYTGLLGVFWGESRAHGAAIPNVLCTAIALCCGIGAVGQLLWLFPATSGTAGVLSYALYPTAVLLLPFAMQVAWPGLSFAWSQPTRNDAESEA